LIAHSFAVKLAPIAQSPQQPGDAKKMGAVSLAELVRIEKK
jgi:hypothetical protein